MSFIFRPFEVVSDPEMSDVTYFVLPGLKPLVKNTTSFLSEVKPA